MGITPTIVNPINGVVSFPPSKWGILEKAALLADKLGGLTTDQFEVLVEGLSKLTEADQTLETLKELKFEIEYLSSNQLPYTRWESGTLYFGLPMGEKGDKGNDAEQVKLKLYYDPNTGNMYYRNVLAQGLGEEDEETQDWFDNLTQRIAYNENRLDNEIARSVSEDNRLENRITECETSCNNEVERIDVNLGNLENSLADLGNNLTSELNYLGNKLDNETARLDTTIYEEKSRAETVEGGLDERVTLLENSQGNGGNADLQGLWAMRLSNIIALSDLNITDLPNSLDYDNLTFYNYGYDDDEVSSEEKQERIQSLIFMLKMTAIGNTQYYIYYSKQTVLKNRYLVFLGQNDAYSIFKENNIWYMFAIDLEENRVVKYALPLFIETLLQESSFFSFTSLGTRFVFCKLIYGDGVGVEYFVEPLDGAGYNDINQWGVVSGISGGVGEGGYNLITDEDGCNIIQGGYTQGYDVNWAIEQTYANLSLEEIEMIKIKQERLKYSVLGGDLMIVRPDLSYCSIDIPHYPQLLEMFEPPYDGGVFLDIERLNMYNMMVNSPLILIVRVKFLYGDYEDNADYVITIKDGGIDVTKLENSPLSFALQDFSDVRFFSKDVFINGGYYNGQEANGLYVLSGYNVNKFELPYQGFPRKITYIFENNENTFRALFGVANLQNILYSVLTINKGN